MTDAPTVSAESRPAPARGHVRLFAALAVAIYVVEFFVARTPMAATNRLLPLAVTLDLTLLVPALFWLLVIRPSGARAGRVMAVFVLSFIGARFVLLPGQREFLLDVRYLGAPLELALMAWIVVKVRRAARGYRGATEEADVPERISAALAGAFPYPVVERVLGTECSIGYYALFSWRRPPHVPSGAEAFTFHRKSGLIGLLVAVTVAAVVELFVVHLLVHAFSARAAWALTLLSVFGVIWLIGYTRAIVLRPVLVTARGVSVRSGVLWTLDIPFAALERVDTGRVDVPAGRAPGHLRIGGNGRASAMLHLREPLEAAGVYGRMKQVRTVSLTLDEPASFAASVRTRGGVGA